MELCWGSEDRIRELPAQVHGRTHLERVEKIAELLNEELESHRPAHRGKKWTQEAVTRYLKKLFQRAPSGNGESQNDPVWVERPVASGFWPNPGHRLESRNWLENNVGYEKAEDWHDVCTTDFRFACTCGNVLLVSRESMGGTEACSHCGRELTVPNVVGTKDSLTEQVIGRTVGGCRILYQIGGGGMGGVFKGHHLGLDLPVAVKILYSYLAENDPIFIKRFIWEARATAKLQHPNVVGVMNVGFENGLHYLIMPYAGGGSAASLLSKVKKLPIAQVLDIAWEITRALILAEEHNIMHRDIKPANILFTEKGEVKLADLGLAKSYLDPADSSITQTGIACGTPLYFSPEQAKGTPDLDIRSDIYSLGITLYHLIEGAPPFVAESAYVIFQKHVHEALPRFTKTDPPVPDSVFTLLKKMTEKKREDRFQSPRNLLEALEKLRKELVTPRERISKRAGPPGFILRKSAQFLCTLNNWRGFEPVSDPS